MNVTRQGFILYRYKNKQRRKIRYVREGIQQKYKIPFDLSCYFPGKVLHEQTSANGTGA